ncbi:hypothetical protein ACFLYD_06350 [Chloroflexota bacterium]|jgi:hypothetical protein
MIWAILAVLGVPIWLVVGGLGTVLWIRSRSKKAPGVFPAKIRLRSGSFEGISEKWTPMPISALWVHDVLLVHKGLALVRTIPLPVAEAVGTVQEANPSEIKRLGEQPALLTFRLDNGAELELATPGDSSSVALGPFHRPDPESNEGDSRNRN